MHVVMAVVLATLGAGAAAPTVAVMKLEAKSGVKGDVAELLSGNLASQLRGHKCFGKVVTAKEIESLIGFEKQKQMLNCDDTSCMAEIAAALGVDYMVSGALGRLGNAWLVNVSLINARTAVTEGSVSRKVVGEDEGALVDAMDVIGRELLTGGKFGEQCKIDPPPASAAAPVVPPPAPTVAAAPVAPPPASPPVSAAPTTDEAESSSSPLRGVLITGGGLGLGGAALGVVAAIVGGLVGPGLLGLMMTEANPLRGKGLGNVAGVAVGGGSILCVAGLAAAALLTALGAGSLAAAFILL